MPMDWGLSLGALARGESLQDIMAQRKAEQLAAAATAEKIRQFNAGLAERQQAHALQAQLREDALKATGEQQQFLRANTLYQETPRGQELTPETGRLLSRFGFPTEAEQTLPSLQTAGAIPLVGGTPSPPADETGTPAAPPAVRTTITPSPAQPTGRVLATGGPKEYLAQQAAEAQRTTAAEQFKRQQQRDATRAADAKDVEARRAADKKDFASFTASLKPGVEPVGITEDIRTSPSGLKYVDGSQYVGRDRNTARKEAHQQGVLFLGKEDAGAIGEAQNAFDNLDYIERQITSKLPKDATGRLIGGTENKLSQFFQSDADLGAFNSLRAAAINSLRAAAGSKGFRMTEAEIQLATENDIPRITDTMAVAKQRLDNMRQLILNAERSHLGKPAISLHEKAAGPLAPIPPPAQPGPSKYKVTVEP